MLQKVIRLPNAPRLFDPAKASARLLGWAGMSLLMIAAPLAGVLSRRSLFVLLPIGAALLFAAFLLAVSNEGLRAFRAALGRPIGLCATFLLGWAAVSLVWTPFPDEVAPRLVACITTIVFTALIIAHLPERRATRALYLLPIGVAATALATLAMALVGPDSFRGGSEFDPSLLERSVLTLVVLVWPALGALTVFHQWRLAMALAALVALSITLAGASIGMAVFAIGAVSFALGIDAAPRTGRRAAFLFAGLVVFAPLLPFVLAPLAEAIAPVGRSTVAAMNDWRALVLDDGARLITGHGLGTAAQGVGAWLPSHTPRTTLFEIWYELGMLGAASLAATITLSLLAAARTTLPAAPALLAGMIVTIAIAIFGVATAQVWFVTLSCLQAVAFGLLFRAARPDPSRPHVAIAEPVPSTPEPRRHAVSSPRGTSPIV